MDTINIWGIKICLATKVDIVSRVHELLDSGRCGIHLTGVNPETIVLAQDISILREAILDSDIVNIDNTLVLLKLRLNGIKAPERAATPDVFELLLRGAEVRGESVFFLGAEQVVLDRMIENVRVRFPNLSIAGYRNGFFSEVEEQDIVGQIKKAKPVYLFIGLPTPQKESFIMKYKSELEVGALYGVGGAFDIWGEKIKRAPSWACKMGLEGMIRVMHNPSDYGRRVLQYYPRFLKL